MDCTTLDQEVDADLARQAEPRYDLVVADASWPWTENLFAPLAKLGVRLLLIKACDWRNAWQQRRPVRDWLCPERQLSPALWERTIILPPGWMKSYPRLGMRPISWAIRNWRLGEPRTRPLVLAISYPHYIALSDIGQVLISISPNGTRNPSLLMLARRPDWPRVEAWSRAARR